VTEMQEFIDRVNADESLRRGFLADPLKTLASEGVRISDVAAQRLSDSLEGYSKRGFKCTSDVFGVITNDRVGS
jgi:hypothetical protein